MIILSIFAADCSIQARCRLLNLSVIYLCSCSNVCESSCLSGLANPAPIIQTFYLEEKLAHHLRLDGVVTLVDAKHATQHIDEVKPDGIVNEAVEQIAYADRIILNKVT